MACYLVKHASILKKCFEKPDVYDSKICLHIWILFLTNPEAAKSHRRALKHHLNFRQADKKMYFFLSRFFFYCKWPKFIIIHLFFFFLKHSLQHTPFFTVCAFVDSLACGHEAYKIKNILSSYFCVWIINSSCISLGTSRQPDCCLLHHKCPHPLGQTRQVKKIH